MIRCLVLFLLACLAWTRIQDQTRVPGASGSEVVEDVVSRIKESSAFPNDILLYLRHLAYVATHDGTDLKTYRPGYDGGIWQVDNGQFNQIKKSSKAVKLFEAVSSQLDIDWTTVQWSDLRKPLYSGLAAALYLATLSGKVQRISDKQDIDPPLVQTSHSSVEDTPEKTFNVISNPSVVSNVCSSGPPHFQPHPQDATKFILCRDGKVFYAFQCIPHYVYNPTTHTCTSRTSQAINLPQTESTKARLVDATVQIPVHTISSKEPVSEATQFVPPVPTKARVPHPLLPTESSFFSHPLTETPFAPTMAHVHHQYREVNPCKNAVETNTFFVPHPSDRHKYFQCDPFGDAFLKTCPDQKIWHQELLTCVLDGLHPAGSIIG